MTTYKYPPGISRDGSLILDRILVEELARFGEIRPPWKYADDEPPYSISWRMGPGEGHILIFFAWWESLELGEEERFARVLKWDPPVLWWPWAGFLTWPEMDDPAADLDELDERAVARLAAAGFGNLEAWRKVTRELDEAAQQELDEDQA